MASVVFVDLGSVSPPPVCESLRSISASHALHSYVSLVLQLEAMVIASCVTPTDPVLANSITKGRFADKHVPIHVRNIIVAESGANDGLGFPFIYLALFLLLWCVSRSGSRSPPS